MAAADSLDYDKVCNKFSVENLTETQKKVLRSLYEKKGVFMSIKTGGGHGRKQSIGAPCDDTSAEKIQGTNTEESRGTSTEENVPVASKVPVARSEKRPPVARVKPSFSNGIDKNELRIVLIGKTGAGKSSTANTILGRDVFKAKASLKSVTKTCNFERGERFGKKILLVDTPGLFDTSTAKEVIEDEVKKCIGISAPGPHAFLLVMSFTNRFTEEEKKVLENIEDMFGDQMINYLFVLFTGRDHIDNGTIEQHIEGCPEKLKSLIQNAGGSYTTFNNRGSDSEKEDDVNTLLNRIDQMVKKNGGGHFTSDMFEAAEKVIQQRIAFELAAKKEEIRKAVEDEIRKEVEDEIRKEVGKEMRAEFDAEKSRLKHHLGKNIQQYQILKRELDSERLKNRKNKEDISLDESFRSLVIDEMKKNTEKKIVRQVEECEGPERSQVHQQLADAGREIKQLLRRNRVQEDVPEEDEDAENAENPRDEDYLEDEFQKVATVLEEQYLEEMRNRERENIEKETGTLKRIKQTMKGLKFSFLNLFK